jgi:DNA-binding NarL/FixJ family response regulator
LLVFSCPALLLGAELTSLAGQAIVNSPAFHPTPTDALWCGDSRLPWLNQAIRLVSKGYTQIGPGLRQAIPQITCQPTVPSITSHLPNLTPREQEIVYWLTKGSSNREIAEALYLSEKTVKNNISNILSRLNLRDRTQLAILALQSQDQSQDF